MDTSNIFDCYIGQSSYSQAECSHTDGHSDNHADNSPCYPHLHTDQHNDHHLDA